MTASLIKASGVVPVVKGRQQGGKNCQVFIGTSGYSYTEWIDGGFYRAGTSNGEMLQQYACQFSAVELSYTWYQMARAEALARLVNRAPKNFSFTAKLSRVLSHECRPDWREQLALYKEGIAPLLPQLHAIIIQFPSDFDRTIQNRQYLANLLDGLKDYPLAVEFRHVSWATDSVFAELERRAVSLVAVDVPNIEGNFPALDVVTNPMLFYMRLHGRNERGWNTGNVQHKFNYDYSRAELEDLWQGRLGKMMAESTKGMVFFNNHVGCHAPRNAGLLSQIVQSS